MNKSSFSCQIPGLLVSVRSAAEAIAALNGGADVIDIKEPDRGSLGAADAETIADVIGAVKGRAPVTAARGELVDLIDGDNGRALQSIPIGVALFKIGLAGCASLANWRQCWQHVAGSFVSSSSNADVRPVAVAYADWRSAQSPSPHDVLSGAIELGCPALLIDTWNKSAGSLFDQWRIEDLQEFLSTARRQNLAVVLAGSLTVEGVAAAVRLMPDLVAVRTAACDAGRGGKVSTQRVRELKQAIATAKGKIAAITTD